VKTREEYNAYMREYNKERYWKLKAEAHERLGGKCVKCGSTENLEIDHIDRRTKSIDVTRFCSVSREKFLAELPLCQLLCTDHHKEKTIAERSVPHGGGLTGKKNCRCELCAPLKNAYARARRQQNTPR
jgi:hypothetical protein